MEAVGLSIKASEAAGGTRGQGRSSGHVGTETPRSGRWVRRVPAGAAHGAEQAGPGVGAEGEEATAGRWDLFEGSSRGPWGPRRVGWGHEFEEGRELGAQRAGEARQRPPAPQGAPPGGAAEPESSPRKTRQEGRRVRRQDTAEARER